MSDDVKRDLLWLEALREAGVDCWDGCSYAQEVYQELLEENDLEEDDE